MNGQTWLDQALGIWAFDSVPELQVGLEQGRQPECFVTKGAREWLDVPVNALVAF